MAIPEFGPGVSGEEGQYLHPVQVATSTAQALDLYFGAFEEIQVANPTFLQRHLHKVTLPYIARGVRGLLGSIGLIDPHDRMSVEDKELIDPLRKKYASDDPADRETFGHMIVTFGALPRLARNNNLPHGYSTHGRLAPPRTVFEFLQRAGELRSQITQIAEGAMGSVQPFQISGPLLRTFLYFKVGSRVPMHGELTQHEQDQYWHEVWSRHLETVNMELPEPVQPSRDKLITPESDRERFNKLLGDLEINL